MKKLLIIPILLLAGCLSTHEMGGLAEGLNRGILLQDPYYQLTPYELGSQLDDINRELQLQTHELRQQSYDLMFKGRDSFGLIK